MSHCSETTASALSSFQLKSYGKFTQYLNIKTKIFTNYYSDLFHPDNIKNYENTSAKVSISVHKLWTHFGGAAGLAAGLKSDTKVITSKY